MKLYNILNKSNSYNIILFFSILLSVVLGRFTDSATIVAIPFLLIIIGAITNAGFYTKKRSFYLVIVFLLCLITFAVHGILPAKDLFIGLAGILATQYFISKYHFSPMLIILVYLLILIPQYMMEYMAYSGQNLSYLPINGRINVTTSTATKHSTSILGLLLLMGSGYFLFKGDRSKPTILFMALGLYFILFSGSRGGLLSLFAAGIIYLINRKKVGIIKSALTISLLVLFNFSLQTVMPIIVAKVNNPVVQKMVGADQFDQYGVTSGRLWLWNYHLKCFKESKYYLGGGREVVDFKVNDFVPRTGEIAKAGSESPFTGLIACYGIIGIIVLLVYLKLLQKAIIQKNIYAIIIVTIAVIQAIGTGNNYFSFYNYNSVLFLNLFFLTLKCSPTNKILSKENSDGHQQ